MLKRDLQTSIRSRGRRTATSWPQAVLTIPFSSGMPTLSVRPSRVLAARMLTLVAERVKVIRYHQGNVKGLAFDPTGELLASQSDDRSVCIWNTTNWSLVARIQEPLEDAPNASFFQRLSWSPEGTFLALPNTVNNGVYVASILKRGNWTGTTSVGTSLVGHDNVVDVTLFNPASFVKDPNKPATGANMCAAVAVAARSTVSIWLTSQTRPVVVFDTIVDRDVLDLSW